MLAVARMLPADLGLRVSGMYADPLGSRVSDRFRLARGGFRAVQIVQRAWRSMW